MRENEQVRAGLTWGCGRIPRDDTGTCQQDEEEGGSTEIQTDEFESVSPFTDWGHWTRHLPSVPSLPYVNGDRLLLGFSSLPKVRESVWHIVRESHRWKGCS